MILMSRTILFDLPPDIKGFVKEDDCGEPVIIINARYTREANLATYIHEKMHCQQRDIGKSLCVSSIENERHKS